jgi:aspartate racemase
LFGGGRLEDAAAFLLGEVERLARAGADFAVVAANTPHLVFGPLKRGSPIPLLSIVDATCDTARARGLRRVGLLGTRYTMAADFYPEGLARAGIEVVVPSADEQAYVHDKYMGELVAAVVRPETLAGLEAVIAAMKDRDGIDGVVLGGTELSLIFRQDEAAGVPLLDTTRIHVEAIVTTMLA